MKQQILISGIFEKILDKIRQIVKYTYVYHTVNAIKLKLIHYKSVSGLLKYYTYISNVGTNIYTVSIYTIWLVPSQLSVNVFHDNLYAFFSVQLFNGYVWNLKFIQGQLHDICEVLQFV